MNIEQTRAKYDKYIKIGLIVVGALVVSPIIFLVVKGMIGLIIATGVGLVAVNVAPIFSMKLANWKVKGIVAEAKANPIETMINLLAEKKEAFKAFKESVETAVTAFKTFKRQTDDFALKYPARAPEFNKQVADMGVLVTRKVEALKDAQRMIAVGEEKLVEMRAYWEMSQAAISANKAAGMDTGDMYEALKSSTAVDAVWENMNQAFAELEIAAALSTPAISDAPSPTLKHKNVITTIEAH